MFDAGQKEPPAASAGRKDTPAPWTSKGLFRNGRLWQKSCFHWFQRAISGFSCWPISKTPILDYHVLVNKQDPPPKAGNHIGPMLTSAKARSDFDSLNFKIPSENWLLVEGPKKEKPAFSVALDNHLWSSMIANKLPQP